MEKQMISTQRTARNPRVLTLLLAFAFFLLLLAIVSNAQPAYAAGGSVRGPQQLTPGDGGG